MRPEQRLFGGLILSNGGNQMRDVDEVVDDIDVNTTAAGGDGDD